MKLDVGSEVNLVLSDGRQIPAYVDQVSKDGTILTFVTDPLEPGDDEGEILSVSLDKLEIFSCGTVKILE